MIVGCDTGFFLNLLQGEERPGEYWSRIVSGEFQAIVSIITFFELSFLVKRGRIEGQAFDVIMPAIQALCKIISLSEASHFSHIAACVSEKGCSLNQAVIASTFLDEKVTCVLTNDTAMADFFAENVDVIVLNNKEQQ